MKLCLYSIYDSKAGVFGEPFTAVNDDVAVRRFNYLAASSPMVAADLELWRVCLFDSESGQVLAEAKPKFICAYEVKKDEEK